MNLATRMENYLREQARRLFPESPDFGDAETIHRMRVASRRLRIGLRFLGVRRVPQLRRLGRALGAVRVLDVNLALLRGAPLRCPSLEGQLAQQRRQRLAELQKLYGTTKPIVWRRGRMDVRRALEESRRAVEKRVKQFDRKGSGAAFHKLRIAAKKYRYGLEIVGATEQIKSLKRLQELMGACHDVEALLHELPAGPLRKHFKKEHDRRFAAVQKFLDGKRRWVKKVDMNHE